MVVPSAVVAAVVCIMFPLMTLAFSQAISTTSNRRSFGDRANKVGGGGGGRVEVDAWGVAGSTIGFS